jgi:hypothetical protein
MSSRFRPLSLTMLAALLACASLGAWAQDHRGGGHDRRDGGGDDRGGPPRGMRDDRGMAPAEAPFAPARPSRRDDDLSDSVRRIERSKGGQVLSAERMQSDGRDVNRIKVLDDRGRVRVYMDDPQQRRQAPTRDDDN